MGTDPFLFEAHSDVTDSFSGFLHDDDDPSSLHSVDSLIRNHVKDYLQKQPPPFFQPNYVYPTPTVTTTGYSDHGLSTQSLAARKRRKLIGEKTKELSRHIPGGAKMNSTADMLLVSYKFFMFLQAQIVVLQRWRIARKEHERHLQIHVTSMAVQEGLAAKGFCIAPSYVIIAQGIQYSI